MQEPPQPSPPRDGVTSLARPTLIGVIATVMLLPAAVRPLGMEPLAALDQQLYDLALAGPLAPAARPPGVVVVAIDDAALHDLDQRWPISRHEHARLIRALARYDPAVIAFDVVFDQPSGTDGVDLALDIIDRLDAAPAHARQATAPLREYVQAASEVLDYDATLARALSDHRVVLGAMVERANGDRHGDQAHLRGEALTESVAVLADVAHSHGTVNVLPDADGVIRRYPYLVEHDGGLAHSLALAAVRAGRPTHAASGAAARWALEIDRGAPLVPWVHPPTTPVLGMKDVVHGRLDQEAARSLAGAIVIVGATAIGADDDYSLAGGPRIPGVLVHAQAAEALMARTARSSRGWATWLGLLLAAALTGCLARWLSGRRRAGHLLIGTAVALGLHTAATLVFAAAGVWTGPATGLVALLGLAGVMLVVDQRELEAERRLLIERELLAQEAQRVKDGFISVVSHELRTPLTSIKGSLGLVLGGVAGDIPERAETMTRLAYDNALRLNRLVDDLLDVAKIEAGRLELDRHPVDLRDVVSEAAESNGGYASEYDVTLEVAAAPDPILVEADRTRIIQVLSNLLSNAVKYSPEGGVVVLRSDVEEARVKVSVCDRGPGIPVELRDRIFEKFSQARGGGANAKGTGLGLGITKAIIEGHEGDIGFDTELGIGTTFWFTLPTVSPPAREPGAASDQ